MVRREVRSYKTKARCPPFFFNEFFEVEEIKTKLAGNVDVKNEQNKLRNRYIRKVESDVEEFLSRYEKPQEG